MSLRTTAVLEQCVLCEDLSDPSGFMCMFGQETSQCPRKKGKRCTKIFLKLHRQDVERITGLLEPLSREVVHPCAWE